MHSDVLYTHNLCTNIDWTKNFPVNDCTTEQLRLTNWIPQQYTPDTKSWREESSRHKVKWSGSVRSVDQSLTTSEVMTAQTHALMALDAASGMTWPTHLIDSYEKHACGTSQVQRRWLPCRKKLIDMFTKVWLKDTNPAHLCQSFLEHIDR